MSGPLQAARRMPVCERGDRLGTRWWSITTTVVWMVLHRSGPWRTALGVRSCLVRMVLRLV